MKILGIMPPAKMSGKWQIKTWNVSQKARAKVNVEGSKQEVYEYLKAFVKEYEKLASVVPEKSPKEPTQ